MISGAPTTPVRWYHLPLPFIASLLLPLVVAAAWLVWQAMVRPSLTWNDFAGDFYFLSMLQALSGLGLLTSLWFLARAGVLPVLFTSPGGRNLGRALGWAGALILASTCFELACDTILGTHLMQDAARLPIAPRTWEQLPVGLLVIAMVAPLAEEVFFRGLLLGWLQRQWGYWSAILGSSLVFGLAHAKVFDPGGLDGWLLTLELSAMGVAFALLALRSGNLWISITAHAANNFCAVLAVFFLLPAA